MKIGLLTPDENSQSVVQLRELFDSVYVYSTHTLIPNSIDIVFVLNYPEIIQESYFSKFKFGMIIIHSTDLPKGRGWAPIYNSIVNADDEYVITALEIDEKVDRGDILMKLRIKKPTFISNNNLREIDESGSFLLICELIKELENKSFLCGKAQNELQASYNRKRTPSDNLVDFSKTIESALIEILATNENYPAFIEINGEKIFLSATPEKHYSLDRMEYSLENFLN